MIFPTHIPETGWVIEWTYYAPARYLGVGGNGPIMCSVTLDDPKVIRFKRKQDAENMVSALRSLPGHERLWKDCVVTHHSWG
jgi:hypothetical protein